MLDDQECCQLIEIPIRVGDGPCWDIYIMETGKHYVEKIKTNTKWFTMTEERGWRDKE